MYLTSKLTAIKSLSLTFEFKCTFQSLCMCKKLLFLIKSENCSSAIFRINFEQISHPPVG